MTSLVTLVIPGRLPSLNQVLRTHWASNRRQKDKWAAHLLARYGRGHGAGRRARVTVTVWRRVRIRDWDNLVGGLKPLLDVLVRLAWLYADDTGWLEHGPHQQVLAGRKPEQIIIEIAYLPTESQGVLPLRSARSAL
jgi:hypothetical protein